MKGIGAKSQRLLKAINYKFRRKLAVNSNKFINKEGKEITLYTVVDLETGTKLFSVASIVRVVKVLAFYYRCLSEGRLVFSEDSKDVEVKYLKGAEYLGITEADNEDVSGL